jgi:hypothetical protein
MSADIPLHLDSLKLEKLIGRQLHCLAICVVSGRTALLRSLAVVFRELCLMLCDGPLFLRCSRDPLV